MKISLLPERSDRQIAVEAIVERLHGDTVISVKEYDATAYGPMTVDGEGANPIRVQWLDLDQGRTVTMVYASTEALLEAYRESFDWWEPAYLDLVGETL